MLRASGFARAAGTGGRSSVSGLVVTVFGATGFLGRYVVNKLGRTGSQVVVPYRGTEKDFEHLKVMGDLGQIVPTPFHLRHAGSLARAVSRSNVVVNLLASQHHTKRFTCEAATVESAQAIAEAARDAPGVERLVYVSSASAAADSPSAFMRAKQRAEDATRAAFGAERTTVLRATQLFGDEDRFFNRLGIMARYWPFVPLLPDRKIAPLSVQDAADAVVAAAQGRANPHGGTFEMAGPKTYDQQKLFEDLCAVMRLRARWMPLPRPVMTAGVKLLARLRKPLITEDEWSIMDRDDVASGEHPDALKQFAIEPTPMESVAINTLRVYRPPSVFYDIAHEDEELIEQERVQRLSPPDYSRVRHHTEVFADRKARLLPK